MRRGRARALPRLHRPRARAGARGERARRARPRGRAAANAASRWATRRVATRRPSGCGSYLARVALAELRRAEGDLERAIEQLEHCVREHPHFIGSVLPYATRAAGGRDGPRRGRVRARAPHARAVAGRTFHARPRRCMRPARRASPRRSSGRCSSASRAPVGRAWRSPRRCSRSGATARQPTLRRRSPTTIRWRCSRAAASCSRASPAATPPARRSRSSVRAPRGWGAEELDLFTAWLQLATSEKTEIELVEGAVEPLSVMLEALLRVHEFEAFETLLELLQRAPITQRERHELLAEMYTRRGVRGLGGAGVDGGLPPRSPTRARCWGSRASPRPRHAPRGERVRRRGAVARPRQRRRDEPALAGRRRLAPAASKCDSARHVAVGGDTSSFRQRRR